MRAGESRKKNGISIYSQHLKVEHGQLLECNCFRSDYCREVRQTGALNLKPDICLGEDYRCKFFKL